MSAAHKEFLTSSLEDFFSHPDQELVSAVVANIHSEMSNSLDRLINGFDAFNEKVRIQITQFNALEAEYLELHYISTLDYQGAPPTLDSKSIERVHAFVDKVAAIACPMVLDKKGDLREFIVTKILHEYKPTEVQPSYRGNEKHYRDKFVFGLINEIIMQLNATEKYINEVREVWQNEPAGAHTLGGYHLFISMVISKVINEKLKIRDYLSNRIKNFGAKEQEIKHQDATRFTQTGAQIIDDFYNTEQKEKSSITQSASAPHLSFFVDRDPSLSDELKIDRDFPVVSKATPEYELVEFIKKGDLQLKTQFVFHVHAHLKMGAKAVANTFHYFRHLVKIKIPNLDTLIQQKLRLYTTCSLNLVSDTLTEDSQQRVYQLAHAILGVAGNILLDPKGILRKELIEEFQLISNTGRVRDVLLIALCAEISMQISASEKFKTTHEAWIKDQQASRFGSQAIVYGVETILNNYLSLSLSLSKSGQAKDISKVDVPSFLGQFFSGIKQPILRQIFNPEHYAIISSDLLYQKCASVEEYFQTFVTVKIEELKILLLDKLNRDECPYAVKMIGCFNVLITQIKKIELGDLIEEKAITTALDSIRTETAVFQKQKYSVFDISRFFSNKSAIVKTILIDLQMIFAGASKMRNLPALGAEVVVTPVASHKPLLVNVSVFKPEEKVPNKDNSPISPYVMVEAVDAQDSVAPAAPIKKLGSSPSS